MYTVDMPMLPNFDSEDFNHKLKNLLILKKKEIKSTENVNVNQSCIKFKTKEGI